jgi:hypothetical protein
MNIPTTTVEPTALSQQGSKVVVLEKALRPRANIVEAK